MHEDFFNNNNIIRTISKYWPFHATLLMCLKTLLLLIWVIWYSVRC